MVTNANGANPERTLTDQSLSSERTAADRVLEQRSALVEEKVDDALADSRAAVDEVRERVRAETDAELSSRLPSKERAQLEEERRIHDRALERERAITDSKLEGERSARRRAIAELLSAERDQTDVDLEVERHRADEEVDSRDDALATISHELRNLIGIVSLSAEKLHQRLDPSKAETSEAEDLQRIVRSSGRMMRLVNDLLDVASIGYGQLTIDPRANDVTLLLEEIRETFEPVARGKGITLDVESDLTSEPVWLDADRIYQVLANLVANALKFTPRGGHVELEAHRVDSELRMSVRDDGAGIATGEQEQIFKRFRQLPEHQAEGHGLGLYICKAITEAHRGRIWVESTPGHGTSFHVALPVA